MVAACRSGGTDPDGSLVHDVGPVLVHMLHLAAMRLEASHAPLLCYCNHQRLRTTPGLTCSQHGFALLFMHQEVGAIEYSM